MDGLDAELFGRGAAAARELFCEDDSPWGEAFVRGVLVLGGRGTFERDALGEAAPADAAPGRGVALVLPGRGTSPPGRGVAFPAAGLFRSVADGGFVLPALDGGRGTS